MSDEEFTRNPEIEAAAVAKLGYTPAQVKRRTVAQLTKELEKLRAPSKEVTFSAAGRIRELERRLRAKQDYTDTLEQDEDFSEGDLDDWDDSIQALQDQVDQFYEAHGAELRELYERRQKKLHDMEQQGLLEPTLARKWAEKQKRLRSQFEK